MFSNRCAKGVDLGAFPREKGEKAELREPKTAPLSSPRSVPAGGASGLSWEVDSLDSRNHNFRSTGHAKGKEVVGFYTMSVGSICVELRSPQFRHGPQQHVEDHFSVSVMTAKCFPTLDSTEESHCECLCFRF